jgi:hypothetical protein
MEQQIHCPGAERDRNAVARQLALRRLQPEGGEPNYRIVIAHSAHALSAPEPLSLLARFLSFAGTQVTPNA